MFFSRAAWERKDVTTLAYYSMDRGGVGGGGGLELAGGDLCLQDLVSGGPAQSGLSAQQQHVVQQHVTDHLQNAMAQHAGHHLEHLHPNSHHDHHHHHHVTAAAAAHVLHNGSAASSAAAHQIHHEPLEKLKRGESLLVKRERNFSI